jgi:hypothetical protein
MRALDVCRQVLIKLFRRHGDIRSFEDEVEAGGGMSGRSDAGTRTVDTRKVVGSVGRAHNLRSDFFYKKGKAITARYERVGAAMQEGKVLPPLELIKVKRGDAADKAAPPPQSEYYVVDGHHRVAMARKLGQDFLDAHVVEVRVGGTGASTQPPATADADPGNAPEQPGRSADSSPS